MWANGASALQNNTTGNNNSALGTYSGQGITTGSNNVVIGYSAGYLITTGSNNVVIGSNTGSTFATGSNNISINDGAGNERIRVLANGNVGIGTVAPAERLDIGQSSAVNATSTLTQLPSGKIALTGSFWNGTVETKNRFTMQNIASTTVNESARLGINWNATEVMSIASNGSVGIGNTAPGRLLHVGSASVGTGLAVANFQNVDGTCTITPASSGSGIACSSDERLKENFQDVTGSFALNRILQLQAVTYNFKTSSTDNRRTGYKAQEVQKIAPEFVRENDDGLLQVYYDAFIPWITEAIKTLHSRITGVENHQVAQDQKLDSQGRQIASKADKTEVDQLKSDNAAKDKKIKELEQRLAKIEKALKSK